MTQNPEVIKLQDQQETEAASIKGQRQDELKKMKAKFATESKESLAERKRELDFTKSKFAAKINRRKEQLNFFRFQEKESCVLGVKKTWVRQ